VMKMSKQTQAPGRSAQQEQPAHPQHGQQPAHGERKDAEFAPRVYNSDDLDIPAFLRRR